MLAATPLVNALSRRNERRADRYALAMTGQPAAFISAMKRLAAQNLAEESPRAPCSGCSTRIRRSTQRIEAARQQCTFDVRVPPRR